MVSKSIHHLFLNSTLSLLPLGNYEICGWEWDGNVGFGILHLHGRNKGPFVFWNRLDQIQINWIHFHLLYQAFGHCTCS